MALRPWLNGASDVRFWVPRSPSSWCWRYRPPVGRASLMPPPPVGVSAGPSTWPSISRTWIATALSSLKRTAAVGAVLLTLVFRGCSSTTRVDAGHVGIRVHLAGSERGRFGHARRHGLGLLQPHHRADHPVSHQRAERGVDRSPHEGRTVDESINFSSTEGVNINADLGAVVPHRSAARAEALRPLPSERHARGWPIATCATSCARRLVRWPRRCRCKRSTAQENRRCSPTSQERERQPGQGRHHHRPAHLQRQPALAAERGRRDQPRHGGHAERESRARTAFARCAPRPIRPSPRRTVRPRPRGRRAQGEAGRVAHPCALPKPARTRSSASRRQPLCSSTAPSNTGRQAADLQRRRVAAAHVRRVQVRGGPDDAAREKKLNQLLAEDAAAAAAPPLPRRPAAGRRPPPAVVPPPVVPPSK